MLTALVCITVCVYNCLSILLLGMQWYIITHHRRLLSAFLPWPSGTPFRLGGLGSMAADSRQLLLTRTASRKHLSDSWTRFIVHFLLKEIFFEFSTIHRELNHVGRLRFYVASSFWQVYVSKPSDQGSSTIFTHAFSVGHHCACVSGTYPRLVSGLVLGILFSSLKLESEVSAPLLTTIPCLSF